MRANAGRPGDHSTIPVRVRECHTRRARAAGRQSRYGVELPRHATSSEFDRIMDRMNGARGRQVLMVAVIGIALANMAPMFAVMPQRWTGVLDEHPAIQYADRPTTDRIAKLSHALKHAGQSLERDPRTGYLLPLLAALGVPVESQVLVFSKTGVQRAYTSPHNPRALFFDESVVVGYIPGAPLLELAAHDPQQGVVFYTLEQAAAPPVFTRRTSCLVCHVSASTLEVPGMIVRSNTVGESGNLMPWLGSHDVNHETPHPDRWGGWFVTTEDAASRYSQRAHAGNITFFESGASSNERFVEWLDSRPETRGYLSPSSDIVALLAFDHQMRAINLMTRLNWESRVASSADGGASASGTVRDLVNELADYLLFVREAPLPVPLTPRPGFARHLEATVAKDRHGRSFGQLDAVDRLLRYPCSYMVYSEAFNGLSPAVKDAVYRRMIDRLSESGAHTSDARLSSDDRHAVLEIIRETKPDFPER